MSQKKLAAEAEACEAKKVPIAVRSTTGQTVSYDVSIGATTLQLKGVVATEGSFKLNLSDSSQMAPCVRLVLMTLITMCGTIL